MEGSDLEVDVQTVTPTQSEQQEDVPPVEDQQKRVTREMFLLSGCPSAEEIEAMYPTYNESVLRISESRSLQIHNELREGKKLLILDLDRTLCHLDQRPLTKPYPKGFARPYLHEFLTAVYVHYDIAVWSASSTTNFVKKIKMLKMMRHPNYKISFLLDRHYIVRLEFEKYGVYFVKPLLLFWLKFPQFDSTNTIIVDDRPSAGLMNRENTHEISFYLKRMYYQDRELSKLVPYLVNLATHYDDFKIAKKPEEQEKLAQLCREFVPAGNVAKNQSETPDETTPKVDRISRSTFLLNPPPSKAAIAAIYPTYHERLHRRASQKLNFEMLNQPREGKKLLVLDIDHTICHLETSEDSQCVGAIRPYLHEFLTEVYPAYDIAIWTASSKESMEKKLNFLKILENPNYKVLFCLDNHFRINISLHEYGVVYVKPLLLIWLKLPQFNSTNTIIVDDSPHVSLMNQENAIEIKRYLREMHADDQELSKLAPYLLDLASHCEDFKTAKQSEVQETPDPANEECSPPDAKRQKLSSPSSST